MVVRPEMGRESIEHMLGDFGDLEPRCFYTQDSRSLLYIRDQRKPSSMIDSGRTAISTSRTL